MFSALFRMGGAGGRSFWPSAAPWLFGGLGGNLPPRLGLCPPALKPCYSQRWMEKGEIAEGGPTDSDAGPIPSNLRPVLNSKFARARELQRKVLVYMYSLTFICFIIDHQILFVLSISVNSFLIFYPFIIFIMPFT